MKCARELTLRNCIGVDVAQVTLFFGGLGLRNTHWYGTWIDKEHLLVRNRTGVDVALVSVLRGLGVRRGPQQGLGPMGALGKEVPDPLYGVRIPLLRVPAGLEDCVRRCDGSCLDAHALLQRRLRVPRRRRVLAADGLLPHCHAQGAT